MPFFALGPDIIAMDDGENTAELHLLGMSAGAPPAQNLDESDDEEFGPRVGEAPSIQGFEWLDDQGQVTVEAVLCRVYRQSQEQCNQAAPRSLCLSCLRFSIV